MLISEYVNSWVSYDMLNFFLRTCSLISHSFIFKLQRVFYQDCWCHRCWRCLLRYPASVTKYAFMTSQSSLWRLWSIMTSHGALWKGYLNEDDDGHSIEKQCDKYYLKWVVSIRQELITAMNITDEYFCRKLFEIYQSLCLTVLVSTGSIFPLLFQTKYHCSWASTTKSNDTRWRIENQVLA